MSGDAGQAGRLLQNSLIKGFRLRRIGIELDVYAVGGIEHPA